MRTKGWLIGCAGPLLLLACKNDPLPKPRAELRLEYARAQWDTLNTEFFSFLKNKGALLTDRTEASWTLHYPQMKGTLFLNYKRIDGDLEKLLTDAQRFSYEHAVKADAIDPKEFRNGTDRVYGQFFSVSGDAASQAQFYATDSIRHFVTGSLYFYARPNYDSIYPAAVYLQNDMLTIMETLRWKE